MELTEYQAKIGDFRKWLYKEFIIDGCGEPKVDGCLSCEAVLVNQGLASMLRIISPPQPKDTSTTEKD